jgi:hypothetical protein
MFYLITGFKNGVYNVMSVKVRDESEALNIAKNNFGEDIIRCEPEE